MRLHRFLLQKTGLLSSVFLFFLFGCANDDDLRSQLEMEINQPKFQTKVLKISGVTPKISKKSAVQMCELAGNQASTDQLYEKAKVFDSKSTSCRGTINDSIAKLNNFGAPKLKRTSRSDIVCHERPNINIVYGFEEQNAEELEYRKCLLDFGFRVEKTCVKNCKENVGLNIQGLWKYSALCVVGPSTGTVLFIKSNQRDIYDVTLKRSIGLKATGQARVSRNYVDADLNWKINGVPLDLTLRTTSDPNVLEGTSSECRDFTLTKK